MASASPRCPASTSTASPTPSGSPGCASSAPPPILRPSPPSSSGSCARRDFPSRGPSVSGPGGCSTPAGTISTWSTTTSAWATASSGIIDDGWPVLTTLHHPITVDRQLALSHATNPWQNLTQRRWFGFLRMQVKVARALPRVVTVSESSKADITTQMGVLTERMTVVPVGVDHTVFRPRDDVDPVPGRIMVTSSSDVPMKGLVPLLEAVAKLRTERDIELVVIGKPRPDGRVAKAIQRLDLEPVVRCVTGISDDELARNYAQAQVAVVPSLYEGFSLPAIEAMACGVALVATTGGALPEVVGTDGVTGLLVPPGRSRRPGRCHRPPARRRRAAPSPGRRRSPAGAGPLHLAGHRGRHRRRVSGPDGRLGRPFASLVHRPGVAGCARILVRARAHGGPVMLTVDYHRLGVRPGDRLLDLGCGFGRHAYQAARLGAEVVALDAGADEVRSVLDTFGAMAEAGEIDIDKARVGAVRGDALRLPFPDASFDRVIASEVLEHIPDDEAAMAELARVLRPGGSMAVTVPRCGPEFVNWALSNEYHDVPGGHVRIYRRSQLVGRLERTGLAAVGSHHAHGLHAPYWWLRCLVGPTNDTHPAVATYHRLLVWDIEKAPAVTRTADRVLNPLVGKSLVVYLEKPRTTVSAPVTPTSRVDPAPSGEAGSGRPGASGTLEGVATRQEAVA